MCGIAGYAGPDADRFQHELVNRMCETLTHRGPDDCGVAHFDRAHLGMRRLAVIDLDGGRQPISSADGSVTVTFNGEIYNYKSLRRRLMAEGATFSTESDTEVIANGYRHWGEKILASLNGMFAIAIVDHERARVTLARDPLGIKPLYVARDGQTLFWGSEIKALLAVPSLPRRLDVERLREFLAWEYVPGTGTLLADVTQLAPGELLHLDLSSGRDRRAHFWRLPTEAVDESLSEDAWRDRVDGAIGAAVREQLVADVPLGAFLSGGVDSSLIVANMGEAQTFSIGFDDPSYNELAYAHEVAQHLGVEHKSEVLEPQVVDLFDTLMTHLDDPIGDFSIFPTFLVSRLTRRHVTVSLSGDGGDELFGGYDTYVANHLARYYDALPGLLRRSVVPAVADLLPPAAQKKGLVNKIKRFAEGARLPEDLGHTRWRLFATEESLGQLLVGDAARASDVYGHVRALRREAAALDPINQALYIDTRSYLVDNCLTKVDRMSMAVSLEARVPFLARELVELAFSIPGRYKLDGTQTKPLLKSIAAEQVPRDCVYRGKEGFSIPIKQWLSGQFRPLVERYLDPTRLRTQGLFNPDTVQRLVAEHFSNRANHSHVLWSSIVFQAWCERWRVETP